MVYQLLNLHRVGFFEKLESACKNKDFYFFSESQKFQNRMLSATCMFSLFLFPLQPVQSYHSFSVFYFRRWIPCVKWNSLVFILWRKGNCWFTVHYLVFSDATFKRVLAVACSTSWMPTRVGEKWVEHGQFIHIHGCMLASWCGQILLLITLRDCWGMWKASWFFRPRGESGGLCGR